MKLQYLGDSKDSFKWDYHDFLATSYGCSLLNIVWMLTPDDKSNDGKTHPSLFPARVEIIDFCNDLRNSRCVEAVRKLPRKTKSRYDVQFHKADVAFINRDRHRYFSNLNITDKQVIFLDPDNGFEPGKSLTKKHVAYRDISHILDQAGEGSVISIFQHFRRKSFSTDYARIKERLESGFSTAIYWHSLMFVQISKSQAAIGQVQEINKQYAKGNPVKVID